MSNLATLFDPFRRGGSSRGLGLGLYIRDQIVRAHGGSITVESDTSGTSFRVTYRALRHDHIADEPASRPSQHTGPGQVARPQVILSVVSLSVVHATGSLDPPQHAVQPQGAQQVKRQQMVPSGLHAFLSPNEQPPEQ